MVSGDLGPEPTARARLVDFRNPDEFACWALPGAVNISLPELRGHPDELRGQDDLVVYCQVGQRGYNAARLLTGSGLAARNLDAGYTI